MLAHTLGNPFDLNAVRDFCQANDLWLIEDNCDALGAKVKLDGQWHYTGSVGDIGTSSFYPPHHMTMGEGGAVYTNNAQLNRIIISLRDWGRDCRCEPGQDNACQRRFDRKFGLLPQGYDHKYVYSHFGYNLKVTDLQAAIGCAQLEKLNRFIDARQRNWAVMHSALDDLNDFFKLPEPLPDSSPSWFGFALTLKASSGIHRESLVRYLESKGIQTRMLFAGNLINHPCFDGMRRRKKGFRVASSLSVTEEVMNNTFWIGVYPGLNSDMIDYMISQIREYVLKMGVR